MEKREVSLYARLAVIGLVLLLGFSTTLCGEGVNIFRNSSFEMLDAGMPEGCGKGGPYADQISVDNEIAFHGRKSVNFKLNGLADGKTRFSAGGGIPFEIGKTYTLSVYIKTKNLEPSSGVQIRLITSGWTASTKSIFSEESTSDWQRYSNTFTIGETKTGNWRLLMLPGLGTKGEIWIDAVQIEEGEEATEYKESEEHVL